jgi:hypothetical protein
VRKNGGKLFSQLYIERGKERNAGQKWGQEMRHDFGLNLICYADEATPRGLPLNLDQNRAAFLDPIFAPHFSLSLSQYIAEKIICPHFFAHFCDFLLNTQATTTVFVRFS